MLHFCLAVTTYIVQRKYVLDLLSETGFLASRPVDTPMDSTVKLDNEQGDLFEDGPVFSSPLPLSG